MTRGCRPGSVVLGFMTQDKNSDGWPIVLISGGRGQTRYDTRATGELADWSWDDQLSITDSFTVPTNVRITMTQAITNFSPLSGIATSTVQFEFDTQGVLRFSKTGTSGCIFSDVVPSASFTDSLGRVFTFTNGMLTSVV